MLVTSLEEMEEIVRSRDDLEWDRSEEHTSELQSH